MTVSVADVKQVLVDLASAEEEALCRIAAPLPDDRIGEFYKSTSAVFTYPSMAPRKAIWRNGGPDFHLCRIGWAAWATRPEFTFERQLYAGTAWRLKDAGMGLLSPLTDPSEVPIFDFRWNMGIGTTLRQYAPDYVSRHALGNMETGKWFECPDPEGWLIPSNETISFPIVPTGYHWVTPPMTADAVPLVVNRFTVHMLLDGWRSW